MPSNKLDDLDELALRAFLDDRGKKILDRILGDIIKRQQASLLSWSVSDEGSERRLIALKHQLTGAELLQRAFMAEVEKYGKELKK